MSADKPPEAAGGTDYNPIFERLVDDSETEVIHGLVAYGLYKIAKREWASGIREKDGRAPTDEELKAYIAAWTPSQLEHVRRSAEQILAEYAQSVIAVEEPRILRRAVRGSFWRTVWPSMTAALLYTLILIGVGIVAARSGVDLLGILRSAASSQG